MPDILLRDKLWGPLSWGKLSSFFFSVVSALMCFDLWVWVLPSLTLLRYMALTFHTLPFLIIPTHSYRTLSLTLFHPNDFFPCLRLPNNTYPPLLYRANLPYPIPSYQIPSLPHPTRILNTILHLYKILLSYTTLSYHIEIEPNRPTAETSRFGTPSKFTQAEKSWPKRPKFCCLHSQNAEIIWTGLQSHSSAKKRFLVRIYGKIGSSPHSIKM